MTEYDRGTLRKVAENSENVIPPRDLMVTANICRSVMELAQKNINFGTVFKHTKHPQKTLVINNLSEVPLVYRYLLLFERLFCFVCLFVCLSLYLLMNLMNSFFMICCYDVQSQEKRVYCFVGSGDFESRPDGHHPPLPAKGAPFLFKPTITGMDPRYQLNNL